MNTPMDNWIKVLAKERAKLGSPIERILFDNDPANGPIAARIGAMLSEPNADEAEDG